MKKILWMMFAAFVCMNASAQNFAGYTNRTTVYEKYQPAKITLASGKVILQKQANIFLKNGRLLFKNGNVDMEANMMQIKSVEFNDKLYVRMDTILAVVVDTVKNNRVLCTTTIDMEAYSKQRLNDRVISNFQMSDQFVSATSVESPDEDYSFPLVNQFFLEINGKVVRSHERTIRRMLPKAKRDRLDFYMKQPDFSWSDRKSLCQVLELFDK